MNNIFKNSSNPIQSFNLLLHFTHMCQMCNIFIILKKQTIQLKKKNPIYIKINPDPYKPKMQTFLPWSSTCKSAIFLWTEVNSLKTLIKSSPFSPVVVVDGLWSDSWVEDEGEETEKPRSAAIERASDIPPMRLTAFLPTQLDSFVIDIFEFCIQTLTPL